MPSLYDAPYMRLRIVIGVTGLEPNGLRCSTGLRSGDFPGQSSTVNLFSCRKILGFVRCEALPGSVGNKVFIQLVQSLMNDEDHVIGRI